MKDVGGLPPIMVIFLPRDSKYQRMNHHLRWACKARLSIGGWERVAVFERKDMHGWIILRCGKDIQ
jgi:hypothetical protein